VRTKYIIFKQWRRLREKSQGSVEILLGKDEAKDKINSAQDKIANQKVFRNINSHYEKQKFLY